MLEIEEENTLGIDFWRTYKLLLLGAIAAVLALLYVFSQRSRNTLTSLGYIHRIG
jgi:hypothetical protein